MIKGKIMDVIEAQLDEKYQKKRARTVLRIIEKTKPEAEY